MEFAAHLPPQTDGSPAAAAPPPLPATSLPSLLAGIRDAPTAADLPSRLRALADAIRARSITVTKQEVIAACKANLDIAELAGLERDGKIVRKEDGQVRTQKAGISYAWNLPRLAERLEMPESELRDVGVVN